MQERERSQVEKAIEAQVGRGGFEAVVPNPKLMTPEEVKRVIEAMSGTPQLVAKLLYGSGLRLLEGLRLRVKDVDFEMKQLTVRDGKGAKHRFTVLGEGMIPALHTFRHSFATGLLQRGSDILGRPESKVHGEPRDAAWRSGGFDGTSHINRPRRTSGSVFS